TTTDRATEQETARAANQNLTPPPPPAAPAPPKRRPQSSPRRSETARPEKHPAGHYECESNRPADEGWKWPFELLPGAADNKTQAMPQTPYDVSPTCSVP